MKEERAKILKMLEEGKVSAEEAAQLLETLESGAEPSQALAGSRRNRFLRIRVFEDGQHKVNVNIPIQLAKVALKFVPQEVIKHLGDDVNLEELIQAVEEGAEGKLVEVNDEDTRVEITVE